MKKLMMILFVLSFAATSHAVSFDLMKRLKAAQGTSGAEHEKVVIEAGEAIQGMRRKMDGTWDSKQIANIVELMRAEKDTVYRLQMLETSAVFLKDNRSALEAAIAKLPKDEAKALQKDLNSTISLLESGQDPDPRRSVPQ